MTDLPDPLPEQLEVPYDFWYLINLACVLAPLAIITAILSMSPEETGPGMLTLWLVTIVLALPSARLLRLAANPPAALVLDEDGMWFGARWPWREPHLWVGWSEVRGVEHPNALRPRDIAAFGFCLHEDAAWLIAKGRNGPRNRWSPADFWVGGGVGGPRRVSLGAADLYTAFTHYAGRELPIVGGLSR